MKLTTILAEITGLEQVKDALEKKKNKLQSDQKDIQEKIRVQKERIRKNKKIDKQRKQHQSIKDRSGINETSKNVSEVLKLTNGTTIGFVHHLGTLTRYFDRGMILVATETKYGTFDSSGIKISSNAIGLLVLGVKIKKVRI
jgi:vacuolar-type H+-ATPase subunit I/STV1